MAPIRRLVDSPAFTAVIVAVILANAVVLGLHTYARRRPRTATRWMLLDALFLAVFFVEMIAADRLVLPARGTSSARAGTSSTSSPSRLRSCPGSENNSTLLRLARLARIVRVVHLLPDVRILHHRGRPSLPPLASMAILTTLIIFVYGMVGWRSSATSCRRTGGTSARRC